MKALKGLLTYLLELALILAVGAALIVGIGHLPVWAVYVLLGTVLCLSVLGCVLAVRGIMREEADKRAWREAIASIDYPDPLPQLHRVVNDLYPATFLTAEVHKAIERLDREQAAAFRQKLALAILRTAGLNENVLPGQLERHERYMDVDRKVLGVLPHEAAEKGA